MYAMRGEPTSTLYVSILLAGQWAAVCDVSVGLGFRAYSGRTQHGITAGGGAGALVADTGRSRGRPGRLW